MKELEQKKIILELQFPNNSENVSRLHKALVHVLEMASSFYQEDPINSNDMFWYGQLLEAVMKASWEASDRSDPILTKPQNKGAS